MEDPKDLNAFILGMSFAFVEDYLQLEASHVCILAEAVWFILEHVQVDGSGIAYVGDLGG